MKNNNIIYIYNIYIVRGRRAPPSSSSPYGPKISEDSPPTNTIIHIYIYIYIYMLDCRWVFSSMVFLLLSGICTLIVVGWSFSSVFQRFVISGNFMKRSCSFTWRALLYCTLMCSSLRCFVIVCLPAYSWCFFVWSGQPVGAVWMKTHVANKSGLADTGNCARWTKKRLRTQWRLSGEQKTLVDIRTVASEQKKRLQIRRDN